MHSFQQFSQFVFSKLGVTSHTLGLEMASSTIRMVSDGKVVAQEPAIAFEHKALGVMHRFEISKNRPNQTASRQSSYQQNTFFHPNIAVKPLVSKGVITDIRAAKETIESIIKKLTPVPSIFNQYTGLCVVPTAANGLELQITRAALPSNSVRWNILPKAILHQLAVTKKFSESGMTAVLDIGSEVTELNVSKVPLTLESFTSIQRTTNPHAFTEWLEKNTVSHTLYWGTKDLEQQLQMVIRDAYQVQLSFEAFQKLFTQVGDDVFDVNSPPKGKFAVRAQSLATGRPVTVTLHVVDLQPAFASWFEYLTTGLSVLLQRQQEQWYTTMLQQGVVVVGGGAAISDLVPAISTFLDVPSTTVPEPRYWTVLGLQLATTKK
jgi:actin-like ATPase involved in cell morphogenesis